MPRNNIYIWNGEEYDYSRWITVAHRGPETCVLHLTDLCEPGKLSRLSSVSCPTDYLKASLTHGTLQITLATGYLLMQHRDEIVYLEFRGAGDTGSIKAKFKAEELLARVDSAWDEGEKLALTV